MAEQFPEHDRLPDAETEARFKRLFGNLVKKPLTPSLPNKDPSAPPSQVETG